MIKYLTLSLTVIIIIIILSNTLFVTGERTISYSDDINNNDFIWNFSKFTQNGLTVKESKPEVLLGAIEGSQLTIDFFNSVGNVGFEELSSNPSKYAVMVLDDNLIDLKVLSNLIFFLVFVVESEIEEDGESYNFFEEWLENGNSGKGIYGDNVVNGIINGEYYEINEGDGYYIERRFDINTGVIKLLHEQYRTNNDATTELKIEIEDGLLQNLDLGTKSFLFSILLMVTFAYFKKKHH